MLKHSWLKRHTISPGWNSLVSGQRNWDSGCNEHLLVAFWASTTRTPERQDSTHYPRSPFRFCCLLNYSYVTYLLSQHIYRDRSPSSSLKNIESTFFHTGNLIFIKRRRHAVCRKWKLKRSHKHERQKTRKFIDWYVKQTPSWTGIYGKYIGPTSLYARW